MITMKELNPHNYPMSPVVEKNMKILFDRMNEIRQAYGKPMTITSGLRSDAKQMELIKQGKSKAIASLHLAGAACDILDKDGSLGKWCLENEAILARIGLWCEHPDYTKGWLHAQIMAPNSGKRFFIP
jgi:hypothetical protein